MDVNAPACPDETADGAGVQPPDGALRKAELAMVQRIAVACAAMLLLLAGSLHAYCPERVGAWPLGSPSAVAVASGHAYIGMIDVLVIADVSSPSHPQQVGRVPVWGVIHDIAISNGLAFVVTGAEGGSVSGLHVIDVSAPSAAVEVGFLHTPGSALGVAVADGFAYVADGHGLRVVDVSLPSAPVEVGWADSPGITYNVVVSSSYAYVAGGGGLKVFDVSDPAAPHEVGFVRAPGSAIDVVLSGRYAYLLTQESGLRVIDVLVPEAPVEVGHVHTWVDGTGVAISGSRAYVAWDGFGDDGGLRIINVSVPTSPVEIGYAIMVGGSPGVAVSDNHAYLLGECGVTVLDVTYAHGILIRSKIETTGFSSSVAASGGYAFVSGQGLTILDVSAPADPLEVASVDINGLGHGVAISGDYAYVVANKQVGGGETLGKLSVFDVTVPSAPTEIHHREWLGGRANAVAVSGSFAYVAIGGGLRIFDVQDPATPVEVAFLDLVEAEDVALSDSYAFVAAGWRGLRVIDIALPSAPVPVGVVGGLGDARGVTVSGSYAYVADGSYGLRVIDVSTPSSPVEVGAVDTDGALDVVVSGGFAYVASGDPLTADQGLLVIDVATPSSPVVVGYHPIDPRWPRQEYGLRGVATSDGQVFLAAGPAGVYVFDECAGPALDLRESYFPAAAYAAGAQGAFFSTDLELNNTGTQESRVTIQWLPRGEENSNPLSSAPFALAPGQSLRWENALAELFGLGPASLGALKIVASTPSVIGMSRIYTSRQGEATGTFGQGLPAIRSTELITGTEPRFIIFLSDNAAFRGNVGCVNGRGVPVWLKIASYDDHGTRLKTTTMDLGSYSNNQINGVLGESAPVNGYVEVWADNLDAVYTCYGSLLDNETSDPTTIPPQGPSDITTFIPAAALTTGLEGAFFQTDVELANVSSGGVTYFFNWLPRGEDNWPPTRSEWFELAPGANVRYVNVLQSVFGLSPDQVGALAVGASRSGILAMSRTYNTPSVTVPGTFGQGFPGIPADRMIASGVKKRIIFMRENAEARSNVGCISGALSEVTVAIELYDSDGVTLETKYMVLPPYSNRQISRIFEGHAPVNGYVDVWTNTPNASIFCYGSVLDNLTSDPTTVLPQ
jgi:hypothetical protein